MSEEWRDTPLGNVCRLNPETVPKEAWHDDRTIRYVDIAAVSDGVGIKAADVRLVKFTDAPGRARRVIRQGDVLVSLVRPNLRSFALVPSDLDGAVCSTGFAVLRSDAAQVLPGFLFAVIRSDAFVKAMVGRCTGSNYPAIKPEDVAQFRLDLPPLPVQRRIVDLIASVDAAVAGASRAGAAVAMLCGALRERLLVGQVVAVGDCLTGIEGGRSPATGGVAPGPYEDGVLKVSAVRPLIFDSAESKALRSGHDMAGRMEVQPGDVLITRANTPDRVGAVCRVPEGVRPRLFLSDKTLRLVPDTSRVDPGYLAQSLNSQSAREHLTRSATGTSKSMYNISQDKIRTTPVRLPSLESQRSIAATLDSLGEAQRRYERETAALRLLRSTLLTRLLKHGLLDVDAYDAPLTAGVPA